MLAGTGDESAWTAVMLDRQPTSSLSPIRGYLAARSLARSEPR